MPKSTYYVNLKKQPTKTETRRKNFLIEIKRIHAESKGIYGAPKIHAHLQKQNKICNLKYIQKIMKTNGIRSKTLKKYRPQSSVSKVVAVAPNLLEQDFTAKNINEKIVGDITYINTSDSGWCYLASFLDLHNNEIYGWEFSKNMTTDIVIKALKRTSVRREKKLSDAIIHTHQDSYSPRIRM
ncbi:MAG: IS3 family transposase [Cetobacterium sp.]